MQGWHSLLRKKMSLDARHQTPNKREDKETAYSSYQLSLFFSLPVCLHAPFLLVVLARWSQRKARKLSEYQAGKQTTKTILVILKYSYSYISLC